MFIDPIASSLHMEIIFLHCYGGIRFIFRGSILEYRATLFPDLTVYYYFFFRLGSTNSLATPEVIMSSLMMTSSNGNIFRVTSYLCGEFTRHRWIPCTKASDRELWCFLWSPPEITVEQTIARLVIWDASSLWRHCNYIAGLIWLIHGGRDKMAAILGTTFSSSFSWMIIVVFWFIFHWNWFLRMQWTMC